MYLPHSFFLAQPIFMGASARELLVRLVDRYGMLQPGSELLTSRSESGRSTNWTIEAVIEWPVICRPILKRDEPNKIHNTCADPEGGDRGFGQPWKITIYIFLRNSDMYPIEKKLDTTGPIAPWGRSVRPSVKYFDYKQHQDPWRRFVIHTGL